MVTGALLVSTESIDDHNGSSAITVIVIVLPKIAYRSGSKGWVDDADQSSQVLLDDMLSDVMLGAVLSKITKLPSVPTVALIALPVLPAESVMAMVIGIRLPSSVSPLLIVYAAVQIVLSDPWTKLVGAFPAIVMVGGIISSLKTIARVTGSFVVARLGVNVPACVQLIV